MSSHKKIFFIIFSSLVLFLMSVNFGHAQTVADGCCETITQDGKHMFTNTKQADCKTTTGNTFVSWDNTMKSSGLQCVPKDTSIKPALIGDKTIFTPQVTVPSSTFTTGKDILLEDSTKTLIDYIIAIFKYAIGIIGIIAAIVLMFAGVTWLTAGGNANAISQAKTYIISSLTGLLLAFCSFLLLSTINNSLVALDVPAIRRLQYVATGGGCCLKVDGNNVITAESAGMSKDKCTAIKKDYQSTTFFENYVADGNTCKSALGCCRLDIHRQSGFIHIPLTSDYVCVDNTEKKACDAETSATLKNYIPLNWIARKDISMDFYQTEHCNTVSNCDVKQTCNSATSCQKMIKDLTK